MPSNRQKIGQIFFAIVIYVLMLLQFQNKNGLQILVRYGAMLSY